MEISFYQKKKDALKYPGYVNTVVQIYPVIKQVFHPIFDLLNTFKIKYRPNSYTIFTLIFESVQLHRNLKHAGQVFIEFVTNFAHIHDTPWNIHKLPEQIITATREVDEYMKTVRKISILDEMKRSKDLADKILYPEIEEVLIYIEAAINSLPTLKKTDILQYLFQMP